MAALLSTVHTENTRVPSPLESLCSTRRSFLAAQAWPLQPHATRCPEASLLLPTQAPWQRLVQWNQINYSINSHPPHAERSCTNDLCKAETKTAKCKSNPNPNPKHLGRVGLGPSVSSRSHTTVNTSSIPDLPLKNVLTLTLTRTLALTLTVLGVA